jgi:hypothetical protein
MAHRLGNQVLGILPGVDAHFGLWREVYGLHGHGVRVPRDVVRQDQDGRLARTHEIARFTTGQFSTSKWLYGKRQELASLH